VEGLQTKFKWVLVNEEVWKQSPDYTSKVHKIFDNHMGGGTSMSYKLFALFSKVTWLLWGCYFQFKIHANVC
jgi:hypothetical protein